ncbi:MAG: hypothetical protein J6K43_03390, partial [Lachnospiraceae bacterium]|nr:hypothetical protein [Lachnospiraceae bacterium]
MDAGISADLTGENAVTGADGTVTVSVSMTYDEDNRLLTYNGQTVEYDEVGNMIKGPLKVGMAEFTYDCRNRLIRVKEEDGTVTAYEYDAENIRTAVITNGIRTEYTTDRESTYSRVLIKTEYEKNFLGFYTEQRARTVYTYGIGLISERRDDGEEYYYHYNHIGSTMAVSDEAGNIIYRFVYDTYGELSDIRTDDGISLKTAEAVQDAIKDITLAELADAAGIEYLYNGQYGVTTDRNGLYYMRARYYDQDIKRFINRDVVSGDITNSLSLNRYCYVQGNPVSLADPFGLCPDGNSTMQGLVGSLANTTEELLGVGKRMLNSNTYGHSVLVRIGNYWHMANVINVAWYIAESDYETISTYGHAALDLAGIVWDGADVI